MKTTNWKILNITTMKLIAAVLMFMDHIHQMFAAVGAPVWLTMAGRYFPYSCLRQPKVSTIRTVKRNIYSVFFLPAGE